MISEVKFSKILRLFICSFIFLVTANNHANLHVVRLSEYKLSIKMGHRAGLSRKCSRPPRCESITV